VEYRLRIAEQEKVKVFDFWSTDSEMRIPKSEIKALFISQSFNGVKHGGLVGRVESKEYAD
jgi:hypothetical protein